MNEAVYYLIIIVCMLALMIVAGRKKHTTFPKHETQQPPSYPKGDAVFLTAHEQQILRAALCVYEKKLNNNVKSNSKNGRQHMNELLTAKIYNVKVLRHKMENYNAGQEHDS